MAGTHTERQMTYQNLVVCPVVAAAPGTDHDGQADTRQHANGNAKDQYAEAGPIFVACTGGGA